MSLRTYLEALKDRMPWDAAAPALRRAGYSLGRGWDGTVEKLTSSAAKNIGWEQVHEILRQNIVFGQKALRAYTAETEFQSAFNEIRKKSFDRKNWVTLPRGFDEHTAIHSEEEDDWQMISFVKERTIDERRIMKRELLPTEFRKYDKVVTYQRVTYAAVDTVVYDTRNKRVFTLIDYRPGIEREHLEIEHRELLAKFGVKLKPVDFRPSMMTVYKSDVGRVVETGFISSSGSPKDEKYRIGAETDLRSETYQQNGLKAVDFDVTFFKLGLKLKHKLNGSEEVSEPEILFNGRASDIRTKRPIVDIFVTGNVGLEELKLVASILEKSVFRDQELRVSLFKRCTTGESAASHVIRKVAEYINRASDDAIVGFDKVEAIVGNNFDESEVIRAMYFLASPPIGMIEERFAFEADGDEAVQISREQARLALAENKMAHPKTGAIIENADEYIYPYFVIRKDRADQFEGML